MRKCVDLCHRDGVIKDRVEEDPARYIIPDPDMVPMLKRFREEGVQVTGGLFRAWNTTWHNVGQYDTVSHRMASHVYSTWR